MTFPPHRHLPIAVIGTTALLLTSCQDPPSQPPRAEVRESVADTTIVYAGDPVWPDTAQLVAEAILGSLEGDDNLFVNVADFQCPACAYMHAEVRAILEEYSDEVAVVFRHYPLSVHPHAVAAAWLPNMPPHGDV